MNTLYRLILSAILAAAATALIKQATAADLTQQLSPILLAGIIFISCAVCALVSPSLSSAGASRSTNKPTTKNKAKAPGKGREQGQVKWFNVSKGYGFVTRSSGEEIFVHFRSIRGSGRKVLRDGQQVEFSVGNGDKGPQAEDVETIG